MGTALQQKSGRLESCLHLYLICLKVVMKSQYQLLCERVNVIIVALAQSPRKVLCLVAVLWHLWPFCIVQGC